MGKYHWHLSFVYTMSRSCVGLGTLCFLAPTFNLFQSVSIALITLKYRIIQLLVNLIRFSFQLNTVVGAFYVCAQFISCLSVYRFFHHLNKAFLFTVRLFIKVLKQLFAKIFYRCETQFLKETFLVGSFSSKTP